MFPFSVRAIISNDTKYLFRDEAITLGAQSAYSSSFTMSSGATRDVTTSVNGWFVGTVTMMSYAGSTGTGGTLQLRVIRNDSVTYAIASANFTYAASGEVLPKVTAGLALRSGEKLQAYYTGSANCVVHFDVEQIPVNSFARS